MSDKLPAESPVETLRAAAAKLRALGDEAAHCTCDGSEPRWGLTPNLDGDDTFVLGQVGCDMGRVGEVYGFARSAGEWAVLVHPGIAEPLATMLEDDADLLDTHLPIWAGGQERPDGSTSPTTPPDELERMVAGHFGPSLRLARMLLGVSDDSR